VDYAEMTDSIFANARNIADVSTETAEISDSARLNRMNKRIDFGAVRTDGSVYIGREGDYWFLRPLNRQRMFYVALSSKRFAKPASVETTGGTGTSVQPVEEQEYWSIPLNGAKEYRWR
jgi:hypothetical protein